MNTTVWTGPDWASIPVGSVIVFPADGEPVWRACQDDTFKPLYRSKPYTCAACGDPLWIDEHGPKCVKCGTRSEP